MIQLRFLRSLDAESQRKALRVEPSSNSRLVCSSITRKHGDTVYFAFGSVDGWMDGLMDGWTDKEMAV